jgi:hypothetical protein
VWTQAVDRCRRIGEERSGLSNRVREWIGELSNISMIGKAKEY